MVSHRNHEACWWQKQGQNHNISSASGKKPQQQITTSCLRQTFREGVNLLDYYAYKGEEGVILLPSPRPISSVNFSEADTAHSKLLEVSNIFFFDLCVSFKQMYVTKYILKNYLRQELQ